jgi:DNA-nicking Smr family endonuclease
VTRKKSSQLNEEDRILWSRVAETVTPLEQTDWLSIEIDAPGKKAVRSENPPSPKPRHLPPPQNQPGQSAAPKTPGQIDVKTRGRIAKGRLVIDARVDLHGLTQSQAHGLLLSFLRRAHADGLRHVLVITGKGTSPASQGVLRRAVPGWFATAPFRGLVSGHSAASRQHGGDGALYVRLRRQTRDGQ